MARPIFEEIDPRPRDRWGRFLPGPQGHSWPTNGDTEPDDEEEDEDLEDEDSYEDDEDDDYDDDEEEDERDWR